MRLIQTILNKESGLCSSPRCVAVDENDFEVKHHEPIIQNIRYNDLGPDSLFKLIESFQWRETLGALHDTIALKYETKQWVTKNEVLKSSWRRLPIHEACIRQPTAAVIAALLDAYPESASLQDNLGRTPLHHAIIHHADISVVFLLLDAHFNGIEDTDFWKKTPRQYAEEDELSNHEVIAAMNPYVDYATIADAASRVRKQIYSSSSHVINVGLHTNTNMNNSRDSAHVSTLNVLNDSTHNRALVELLEEELAQARVEADTAYAQRDIAMENELTLKHQLQELKELLTIRQDEARELQELSERNRNISYLLRQLEEKQAAQDEVVKQKDKEISKLRRKMEAQKKSKGEQIAKVTKKAEYEKKRLVSTVTSLTQKIHEMEKDLNENQIQNSISSSPNCCSVSQDCTEASTIVIEDVTANADMEKIRSDISCSERTNMKIEDDLVMAELDKIKLEKKLERSYVENEQLEKDVTDVKKRHAVAMDMISALEDALELYQNKVKRLEDGFYQVTDSLLSYSKNLGESRSYPGSFKRSISFHY